MKIQLKNIDKSYDGTYLLNELNLEIILGSKVAIVGENGSGKSTLLKIMAGLETYEGEMFIPNGIRIGYLQQVFPSFEGTARDFVMTHFDAFNTLQRLMRELESHFAISEDLDRDLAQYARLQEQFESMDGYDFENRLEMIAKGLGVYGFLENAFDTLSGGQKTRLALLVLLLSEYEVLCLDEPTNHLDMEGIVWLENFCKKSKQTLLIVSHDRTFLNEVVDQYHEIDQGNIVSYYGSFEAYRKQKHERFLNLLNNYEQQQKEIQRIKLSIRRYRQWGHEADNEAFFKKAKTLEKRLERMETLPKPSELQNKLSLDLKVKQRSGEIVVEANDLVIGYDKPLTQTLNFKIRHQDRFAIMAENGTGKTTLIKTIMEIIEPLSGSVYVGPSVNFSYLSQVTDFPDRTQRILEYVQETCQMSEFDARRALAHFGFYQQDVYKPLSYLSGGEGVRIRLLVMMHEQANCIILDEPTNHLDVQSCEIIEAALREYIGTLIIVSHDRMFLDNMRVQKFWLS